MKARHIFTLLVAALAAAMAVGAFDYAGTAAFGFPFVVSAIVLVMALLLFVAEFRAGRRGRTAADTGTSGAGPTPTEDDRPVDWAGIATVYGFLLGFLIVAHFVSYLVAVPTFLFLFGTLFCRERWLPTAVLAACVGLGVFVVFDRFLPSF